MENNQNINTQTEFSIVKKVVDEIEKVIVGKREVVKMLMVALLSSGHVLIEDVPGVGKTTLAMALGKATGLVSKRVQFTPDVMSSDITGFTMYNKELEKFEYRSGMVMSNILLADEINRTSPKTQSALLEAMEEHNVTVDGIVHKLPEPFMVIATQNELGYVGTFPLPEAQLDRFLIKVSVGYPTPQEEIDILANRRKNDPIKFVESVCSKEEIEQCIDAVKKIHIEPSIYKYIVDLVGATRNNSFISLGGSPRASLALMRASQSFAFVHSRSFVSPEDVAAMLPYVLSHRLQLTQEAKIKHISVEQIVATILQSIAPPFKGKA